MEVQMPADLSRLKFLAKSKHLIKKTESGDFEKGNIDEPLLYRDTSDYVDSPIPQSFNQEQNITESAIDNSRLPESIKRAMKENPVIQQTAKPFSLDDDLEYKTIPTPIPIKRKPVNETTNKNYSNLSDENVRNIVQEELAKFFSSYFIKDITESIQKQTIKDLLNKGIIQKKVVK